MQTGDRMAMKQMLSSTAGKWMILLICGMFTVVPGVPLHAAPVSADVVVAGVGDKRGEYHTPLAGEPLHTEFMGQKVDLEKRDRGSDLAITLGGALYLPQQGNTDGLPIFAFYLRKIREEYRLRAIVSIFVNEIEAAKRYGTFEVIGRLENNTIPFGQMEVLNNRTIKGSSVEWGTVTGYAGGGVRIPVHPLQVDNDLKIALLAKVGYFYNSRTSDMTRDMILPPNTMIYGGKLRGRDDGFRRNLMELPHEGFAAGFDFDYDYRAKWSDYGSSSITFSKNHTQDYAKYSGYLMAVVPFPRLSEKNRLLVTFHGGAADKKSIDRYNGFRIGGGPFPGESDDLYRPPYPGALFNDIIASDYMLANLEYRRELAFFMFLHLRGTYVSASRATIRLADDQSSTNLVEFRRQDGEVFSAGLTSGLPWNSMIYMEYAWDSGFMRNGKSGSSLLVNWSKSF